MSALLVMIGFLLQWPTIPTLIMFPILAVVYSRLARGEERDVADRFGEQWDAYAAQTPAFLPRRQMRSGEQHHGAASGRDGTWTEP